MSLEQGYMEFVMSTYDAMVRKNIMLIYKGEVNQGITKLFTTIAEENMEKAEEAMVTNKRVYHVMVELLQNIYRHSDSSGDEYLKKKEGIFLVAKDMENYYVTSGNLIHSDNVSDMLNMIDEFNGLSEEEIRVRYKELIVSSRISEKGGAGLGFIDIIKKTGNPIDYYVSEDENGYSFFVQRVTINRS